MNKWRRARVITLRQQRGGTFVLLLDGVELDRGQRFKVTMSSRCGRCGCEPPTFAPRGYPGAMAMCEACIVEVLSVMAFAAESALESGGQRNGQG